MTLGVDYWRMFRWEQGIKKNAVEKECLATATNDHSQYTYSMSCCKLSCVHICAMRVLFLKQEIFAYTPKLCI